VREGGGGTAVIVQKMLGATVQNLVTRCPEFVQQWHKLLKVDVCGFVFNVELLLSLVVCAI
jgi:hypothetical protein